MDPTAILPEMAFMLAKAGWESYSRLHQQWCEAAAGTEETISMEPFDKKGQELLKAGMEFYEKEIRGFLSIPQLGLTRCHQERVGEVLDKFNLFQAKTTEFIYFLSQPVEKSFKVMQGKLREMKKKGAISDDPKDYYQMWISTLEGYYMTLFKSSEYVEALQGTLDSITEFSLARQRFLQGLLQLSSVPSYTEIDDLSKEVYELKKQIKDLARKRERSPALSHRARS
jgi:polyhydroxyalkanoate synthase subunit PhaE